MLELYNNKIIWSEFTKKYLTLFKNNKYNLVNDNNFIKLLKFEKKAIINFINKNKNLKLDINTNYNSLIHNLFKTYANCKWVNTEAVLYYSNRMNINIIIKWNNIYNNSIENMIIIKSKKYYNLFKRLKILILLIEYLKYKTNNINKNITIFLILTKLKKYLPSNNEIIDTNNVNSGYSNLSTHTIYIWRLEEVEKVILHEIIHILNLDVEFNKLNHKFIIKGPTNYFEAITDFWGIFYNLIYLSILTNYSIKEILEIELAFIRNQAFVLNNYFKLNNWECKKIIEQNTPAFSYYILKYLLFKYMIYNESYLLNEFIFKYKKFNKFEFYNEYDNIFKKILSNEYTFKDYNYIKIKSGRMTLLELA